MRRMTLDSQGHGYAGPDGSGYQHIIWTGISEFGGGNFNAKGDGHGYGGIGTGVGYDHGTVLGNGEGEGHA